MTASTATSDMAALTRSSRPASGSRYSGSTIGPSTSSSAITGRASRKTEPHQKFSSRIPPSTGPIALPAENAEIQIPMATPRCLGSWNMVKMSDSVDGASVAPGDPEERAAQDQHLGARGERGEERQDAEGGGADQEQLPPADPVSERAHRDEETGDHEAVDVDDPQQLGAGRLQVLADGRDRQVQHRQVHDVQQAGEGEDGKADPLAAAGSLDPVGGHLGFAPFGGHPFRPEAARKLIAPRTDEFRTRTLLCHWRRRHPRRRLRTRSPRGQGKERRPGQAIGVAPIDSKPSTGRTA